MQFSSKIVPCIWFDNQGEEAAKYYVEIFPKSKIIDVTRYPGVGQEVHGQPEGKVLTVEFELDETGAVARLVAQPLGIFLPKT